MKRFSWSDLPVRDDPLVRARALLIARIAIMLYLVELVLNLIRPRLLSNEPALSIFYKLPGASGSFARLLSIPRLVFWTVLVGIAAGAVIQITAAVLRRFGRSPAPATWITLGCLLLPFGLIPLTVVFEYFPTALACVPSTAFVLLLLHEGVRFARVSRAALLAAFGWGALIVFGLGRAYSGLASGPILGYLTKPAEQDPSRLSTATFRGIDLLIVHLSIVNTLAVAAGVALLLLLFRHRVTDAVTGLTLGAAIGLGYNFVESILFIKLFGSLSAFFGSTGGFEYWIRQSIGLLGGQVAFGALVGAGLGAAAKARSGRGTVTLAALAAAVGGATATETLTGWLSQQIDGRGGGALDTLVVSPFVWLLPQLPFLALAVALLVLGLRARGPVLRAAAETEAEAGRAITRAELAVLVSPALRFWALAATWRTYGRGRALALHRLQTAQLELASWRAQDDPAEDDPAVSAEGDELRARVMRLKDVRPAVTS